MGFNDVEEARKLAKKKEKEAFFIAILLILGGIALMFFTGFYMIFPIVFIGPFVVATFYGSKEKKAYSLKYKEYFVKNSLNAVLTDLSYTPDMGIPREEIAATEMMHMGDIYTSNDLVEGKYKGISVRQSDVDIEEEHESTDSDGNTTTYYVTIFKGRWMIFDFNKEFKANIQVAQKGFGNNRVNNGSIFNKKKEEEKYKVVKMESADFNKRFKVYAQNEIEAFYILTPSVMEKINRLDDNNTGKLLLCFVNDKLHVGLYDNKDSFEAPKCSKKLVEADEFQKINKDLVTITQFVDELNLDNTLFKNSSAATQSVMDQSQQVVQ